MFCRNPRFTLSPQRCLSARHAERFHVSHYLLLSFALREPARAYSSNVAQQFPFTFWIFQRLNRNHRDFCDDTGRL